MNEPLKKLMILERIKVKSGNERYSAEVPIVEGYTGSVSLVFHWKDGRVIKAEVSKRAEMTYPLLTKDTDSSIMDVSE